MLLRSNTLIILLAILSTVHVSFHLLSLLMPFVFVALYISHNYDFTVKYVRRYFRIVQKFDRYFVIYCNILQSIQYKVTKQVFFDIKHGNEDFGRIIIGLFGEIAPKTVQNFITIAKKGINGKKYAGSTFHRVIPRFMIQGNKHH